MHLLLAQDMPDPKLLQGDAQEILVWVVLALVALWVGTVTYFIVRELRFEKKQDKLYKRFSKLLVRSNRAIEALADLPPPPVEEDLEDDEAED